MHLVAEGSRSTQWTRPPARGSPVYALVSWPEWVQALASGRECGRGSSLRNARGTYRRSRERIRGLNQRCHLIGSLLSTHQNSSLALRTKILRKLGSRLQQPPQRHILKRRFAGTRAPPPIPTPCTGIKHFSPSTKLFLSYFVDRTISSSTPRY